MYDFAAKAIETATVARVAGSEDAVKLIRLELEAAFLRGQMATIEEMKSEIPRWIKEATHS